MDAAELRTELQLLGVTTTIKSPRKLREMLTNKRKPQVVAQQTDGE